MPEAHPVFHHLRQLSAAGPVVVAHRGASRDEPENTLRAFRAARAAGAPMQEFDVRRTRDGVLVCMHDATLDRTTDAAQVLGPGALVAQLDAAELLAVDAGRHRPGSAREPVPTLAAALAAILPDALALVEHKAGDPTDYAAALRQARAANATIVQSFDWAFVAAMRRLAPEFATAVLGPNAAHPHLDRSALAEALALGVGMVHWAADELTAEQVHACHGAGILVCSYTTDTEPGWRGLAEIGVDAICSNDPAAALRWRDSRNAKERIGPSRRNRSR